MPKHTKGLMQMIQKIKSYVAAFIAVLMAVKELVLLVEVPGNGETKKETVLEGVGILVDLAGEFLSWLPTDAIMKVAEGAVELWGRFNTLTDAWRKQIGRAHL